MGIKETPVLSCKEWKKFLSKIGGKTTIEEYNRMLANYKKISLLVKTTKIKKEKM